MGAVGWARSTSSVGSRTLSPSSTRAGRPIELVGEPGIGKTRLLAELARRADERGQIVLCGSASELERDLPFWVFVDALDDYSEGSSRSASRDSPTSARIDLAAVLPSLPAPDAVQGIAGPDERYRSYRAVRELLELLAHSRPLVLILDDLHWGDPASVELLGALLAGLRRLLCCSRSRCVRARCRTSARRRSNAPSAPER